MADSGKTEDKVRLTDAQQKAPESDPPEAKTEDANLVSDSDKASGNAEAGEEKTKKDGKDCCSCGCVCRAIVFILTTPILIIILAFSVVLWIILLPLKCLCPCIAPCLQCVVDAILWLVKLPIRFLRWVTGRPDTDEESKGESTAVTAEEGKVNYGATGDEEK